MATNFTELPKTQFSGLEYANIMEDIYNLIQENPEYNENWSDFLNSNAGRMLTEVFAYIADQLATRIDWVVNENFIGTATQRSSIIKLLKLIGYKFTLPVSSIVPITITTDNELDGYVITPEYIEGTASYYPKTLQGRDLSGNLRSFEAIEYDSTNQKYSYKVPVTITTKDGEATFDFHEGVTKIKDFTSTASSGQKFTLTDTPIIHNSVVVYLVTTEGTDIVETKLLEVDNFLSSKAQKVSDSEGDNAIPYVLNVNDNNSVDIEFGPISLLPAPDRRLSNGAKIRVFYRVGGGLDGNITIKSIAKTEKVNVDGTDTAITYTNLEEGTSGTDAETIDHAAYYGPLQMRTGGKTVTPEDYEIILSAHTSMLKTKSYGYNNIPDDYYEKYGTYFNPLEVVSFVVLKKPGWESRPTSKYYLSNWGTFNLENRFNGEYWFSNGSFGNKIEAKGNDIIFSEVYDYDNQGGRIFNNYTILKTPNDYKTSIFIEDPDNEGEYIANPQLKSSLTIDQFDRALHTKLTQLTDHLVCDESDPYFYGDYNETGYPRVEIREDIHAFFRPTRNVSDGINISTGNNKFMINIDGQGDITIDLSKGGVSPAIVPIDTRESPYVEGVIDIINNAVAAAYYDVKAYQDFGILIEDTTDQVPNLENKDEEDWILRITGINYTVNTGVDQSYDQMMVQINSGINAAGYEAVFVQNRVNISCYDIRIQRTDDTGTVVLEDSNDPYDILVAYEAAPLSTSPVSSGDYSEVATKVTDLYGTHVRLESPNSGSTSTIVLKDPVDTSKSCMISLFGLDTTIDGVSEYTCYGQQALTVIYRDTTEEDFANFIWEIGTINFSPEQPDIVYLNYISEIKDTIPLGHYFHDNFVVGDPEYKEVDTRIYNAQFKLDQDDPNRMREYFDLDNSDILLKFTREETVSNSIYTIVNDYNLKKATKPIKYSMDLTTFPDLSDSKILTIQVNDNAPEAIDVSWITSLDSLITTLNSRLGTYANEMYDNSIPFAVEWTDEEAGTTGFYLQVDNNKDGKITIIGETNSANVLLFDDISSESDSDVTYAEGDYYLTLNESTDSIDMVMTGDAQGIPDVPFYIHYIADRRHKFIDPEIDKVHTDEDDLLAYMYDYKVAGVENIFKRPVFTTFDLKATIYISTAFTKAQIEQNVNDAIQGAYSLENTEFNTPIIKAELTKVIMEVPGVRYIEVSYFGKDMTDDTTNVDNRIDCDFDELIVVSDDTYDKSGDRTHGLNLTYSVI